MEIPEIDVELLAGTIDKRRWLSGGETLLEQGADSATIYVVTSGAFDLQHRGHTISSAAVGSVIGDLSMLTGGRQPVGAIATEASEVLVVSEETFDRYLHEHPDEAESVSRAAARQLGRVFISDFVAHIFGQTDAATAIGIEQELEWMELAAGDTLYEEHDPSDAAYFVVAGRLRMSRFDGNMRGVLRSAGRNQIVGHEAFISRVPRPATALAVRDTTLIRLGSEAFDHLLVRYPEVTIPVVKSVIGLMTPGSHAYPETVVALAFAIDIEPHGFTDRLCSALDRFGSTAHIWSAKVDEIIGIPEIAQSALETAGDVRLSQLLYELEVKHSYTLYETDPDYTVWTGRTMRHADYVLLAVSANPSEEELVAAERLLSGAPPDSEHLLLMIHPSDQRPADVAAILDRLGMDRVIHVRERSTSDFERLARVIAGRAVGLVLGGGGARGFAHIGVHRAMHELGIPIDITGGSSVGAPIGALIAKDIPPDELEDSVADGFAGLFDYTIPLVSVIKGRRLTASMERNFAGYDIEDLWLTFYCLSSNLTTAKARVHRRGPAVPAIRASVAIPGFMPPVPEGSELHVDAGVLNNLPADVMREINPAGSVVAVDVAADDGPEALHDFGLYVSGWKALRSRFRRGKGRYPKLSTLLIHTMLAGATRERDRQIAEGMIDLYFSPELTGVSLLDFEQVRAVAAIGYEQAMPVLEEWLSGVGSPKPVF